MTELRLSCECELDNLQDSLIKDMIVCGTRDNFLRKRLLRECDLPLSKATSAGHAAEKTRKHAIEILRSQPTAGICPVNIKLPAYNNSKIPVLGKCSLTLKHKKYHLMFHLL